MENLMTFIIALLLIQTVFNILIFLCLFKISKNTEHLEKIIKKLSEVKDVSINLKLNGH